MDPAGALAHSEPLERLTEARHPLQERHREVCRCHLPEHPCAIFEAPAVVKSAATRRRLSSGGGGGASPGRQGSGVRKGARGAVWCLRHTFGPRVTRLLSWLWLCGNRSRHTPPPIAVRG